MILYLDTETTGLYPGNIVQLSYIMQTDKSVSAKNIFFTVDYVEPSAYAVHGFSVEKLRLLSGGRRFSDFIDVIEKDFDSADVIISHNTAFDFMFLRKEFEFSGKIFSPKNEFCSMKKTVALCKLPRSTHYGYKYPKMGELCNFLGVSDSEIAENCNKFFGANTSFHDARFDTTALFTAVNKGMKLYPDTFNLIKYL